jgi:hypothetical protein
MQVQLLPEAAEDYAATLRQVAGTTPPSARFVRYHDALLQHLLHHASVAPR